MEDLERLAIFASDKLELAQSKGDQANQMYWSGYLLALRHLFEAINE